MAPKKLKSKEFEILSPIMLGETVYHPGDEEALLESDELGKLDVARCTRLGAMINFPEKVRPPQS